MPSSGTSAERSPRLLPMAATRVSAPPAGRGLREAARWSWEVKWDGMRAIVTAADGQVGIRTRNDRDVTSAYPELRALADAIAPHRAVLDGEIVIFDNEGVSSFELLQRRMHIGSKSVAERLAASLPVTLVLFDLLWLDGDLLTGDSYDERRALLAGLTLEGPRWRTPRAFDDVDQLRARTLELGMEGVVGKRRDSTYQPGKRSSAWVKLPHRLRQEVVIGGWLPGEGRRADRIGALLVGIHDDTGQLRYAGRVGTGFTDARLQQLADLLGSRQTAASPFSGRQPAARAIFTRPDLVAEIEARAWTGAGTLRHPSFKGLRHDKRPADVVRERPAGQR